MDESPDYIVDDVERHVKAEGFLPGLARQAAATHIGLYLGWAIERGMISERMQAEHAVIVQAFRNRTLTGPRLLGELGGAMHARWLGNEVGRFTSRYYSPAGRFRPDYVHTFLHPIVDFRSMYVVADNWESQAKLAETLDRRFVAWRIFPPAAEWIFDGRKVGMAWYYPLETVAQTALLIAARALTAARTFRPFVVFLTAQDEVRAPKVLAHHGKTFAILGEENVMEATECLREGLALRTLKAFAVASYRVEPSTNTPEIQVVAEHQKAGAYKVSAPYGVNGSGLLTFARPEVLPYVSPEPGAPAGSR